MGLDAETVALSPFGPSQSGRFYGINNLLETMLLAPALARCGAARARPGSSSPRSRSSRSAATASAPTAAASSCSPPPTSCSGCGCAASGRRWRLAGLVAAGAVALALALLGLDAATGGSSHVTDAVGDGPVALAGDIADRIELSVRRTAASVGATAVVLGSLAILVARRAAARAGVAVLDAFLVGIAVSLVVNDTPGDVLGMGAAIAIALARYTPERGCVKLCNRCVAPPLCSLLLAFSLGLAGCGGGEEVIADARDDRGHAPDGDDRRGADDRADVDARGRRRRTAQGLRLGRLRRLPHARGGRRDRHRRPEPRRREARRSRSSSTASRTARA